MTIATLQRQRPDSPGIRLTLVPVFLALIATACVPAKAPAQVEPVKATARSFAEGGEVVFDNICRRCHGARGQGVIGPAIIGANANLRKFGTAQGLYDYISVAMPFEAPGSLSRREYLQVMSYLLIENKLVGPTTVVDPDNLKIISLQGKPDTSTEP